MTYGFFFPCRYSCVRACIYVYIDMNDLNDRQYFYLYWMEDIIFVGVDNTTNALKSDYMPPSVGLSDWEEVPVVDAIDTQ